jgi:hypothetical protein
MSHKRWWLAWGLGAASLAEARSCRSEGPRPHGQPVEWGMAHAGPTWAGDSLEGECGGRVQGPDGLQMP